MVSDIFDSLDRSEVGSDLDWQGTAEPIALRMRRGQGDAAPAPLTQVVPNRDALDQAFAQTADSTNQTTEDE